MISANPQEAIDVDCESVTGKTVTIRVRFLTSIERKRHRTIVDTRIDGKVHDEPGVLDAAREAIEIGIVGTTFEALQEHLTDRELCLLAIRYPVALDLTEIDLGKFTSRLRSIAGKSAANAVAAVATNPTNEAR